MTATADNVTLTLPVNGSVKVGNVTYTGLDETNSAVFTLNGTVEETSDGRFNVEIPQNNSAFIDGTIYTANQGNNNFEIPATDGVRITSSVHQ